MQLGYHLWAHTSPAMCSSWAPHTPPTCVQVLAEQARRLGIVIEAENALENSAARAAVSKKKKDPGYSLEISSIHRRVKEMMKARTAPEAEASAGRGTSYQPVQESASALPSGWEARTDESSGGPLEHASCIDDPAFLFQQIGMPLSRGYLGRSLRVQFDAT